MLYYTTIKKKIAKLHDIFPNLLPIKVLIWKYESKEQKKTSIWCNCSGPKNSATYGIYSLRKMIFPNILPIRMLIWKRRMEEKFKCFNCSNTTRRRNQKFQRQKPISTRRKSRKTQIMWGQGFCGKARRSLAGTRSQDLYSPITN